MNDDTMKEKPLPLESTHSRLKSRGYMDLYAYDVRFFEESYTVLSVKSDGMIKSDDDCFGDNDVSVSHFQIADDSNHLLSLKRSVSVPSSKCCKTFKDSSAWKLLK